MSEQQSSGSSMIPILLGAVVVIGLIGGAAFYFLSGNSGSDSSQQMAQAQADSHSGSGDMSMASGDDMSTEPHLAKTDEFGTDGGLGTGVYAWDAVEGNADAPVTLIEYASWSCPACRAFQAGAYKTAIEPAIEDGRVKLIVRDLIRNGIDVRVTMAARCEGIDFKKASDALFTNQPAYLSNDPEQIDLAIINLLSDQGMTAAKYVECLSNNDMSNFVMQISGEGSSMGVNSTPTLFLNGRRVDLATLNSLDDQINRAIGN